MRLVALLGLIACSSGAPTPTPTPADTDTDVHVDPCPGLSEADCAAEPSCWPVDGRVCADPTLRSYVGCVDAESDCSDIEWSCAREETPDACVSMPASCDFIVEGVARTCPEGWVDCGADPTGGCP